MDTNTASNRMHSLVVLYDIHTKYFNNALAGLTDSDTHNRLNTKANHIAWITGSLVHERFDLAKTLGGDAGSSAINENGASLFENNKGIQDGVTYPSITAYKKDWEAITPVLRNTLLTVTDEKLDEKMDMGGMTMSFYDLVVFIIYREGSCIGQIALWRRLLDLPAMDYM